jgi:hypothetical protein
VAEATTPSIGLAARPGASLEEAEDYLRVLRERLLALGLTLDLVSVTLLDILPRGWKEKTRVVNSTSVSSIYDVGMSWSPMLIVRKRRLTTSQRRVKLYR